MNVQKVFRFRSLHPKRQRTGRGSKLNFLVGGYQLDSRIYSVLANARNSLACEAAQPRLQLASSARRPAACARCARALCGSRTMRGMAALVSQKRCITNLALDAFPPQLQRRSDCRVQVMVLTFGSLATRTVGRRSCSPASAKRSCISSSSTLCFGFNSSAGNGPRTATGSSRSQTTIVSPASRTRRR